IVVLSVVAAASSSATDPAESTPPTTTTQTTTTTTTTTTTLLCFEPRRSLTACPKLGMGSEAQAARCGALAQSKPPTPPRFRVGKEPWVQFSPTSWLCRELAIGERTTVSVGGQGSAKIKVAACDSGALAVRVSDLYGGISVDCMKHQPKVVLLPAP